MKRMSLMTAYGYGFVGGIMFSLLIFQSIRMASAADLPLPKPRPGAAVISVMPPERCLITGENPDPGQTLHVDKRCKSGLRWVYQH